MAEVYKGSTNCSELVWTLSLLKLVVGESLQ